MILRPLLYNIVETSAGPHTQLPVSLESVDKTRLKKKPHTSRRRQELDVSAQAKIPR